MGVSFALIGNGGENIESAVDYNSSIIRQLLKWGDFGVATGTCAFPHRNFLESNTSGDWLRRFFFLGMFVIMIIRELMLFFMRMTSMKQVMLHGLGIDEDEIDTLIVD